MTLEDLQHNSNSFMNLKMKKNDTEIWNNTNNERFLTQHFSTGLPTNKKVCATLIKVLTCVALSLTQVTGWHSGSLGQWPCRYGPTKVSSDNVRRKVGFGGRPFVLHSATETGQRMQQERWDVAGQTRTCVTTKTRINCAAVDQAIMHF